MSKDIQSRAFKLFFVLFLVLPLTAVSQPFTFNRLGQVLSSGAVSIQKILYADGVAVDFDRDGSQDFIALGVFDDRADGALLRNNGVIEQFLPGGVVIRTQSFQYDQMSLANFAYSSLDVADLDGNGHGDIVVSGAQSIEEPFNPTLHVYLNQGQRSVTLHTTLPGLYGGGLALADYDNDADIDFIVSGRDAFGDLRTILYANNGSNRFVDSGIVFPGFAYSDFAWGDIDGDGDLDLAAAGTTDSGDRLIVYRNTNGTFSEIAGPFRGVTHASLDWADAEADGDLDLLVSGGVLSDYLISGDVRVYRNEGSGFSEPGIQLPGLFSGLARWGDLNHDGYNDILIEGVYSPVTQSAGMVYTNNKAGLFSHTTNLLGNMLGISDLADFDGDGDLDPYSMGLVESGFIPALFRNDHPNINFPPLPPSNLQANVNGRNVVLSWSAGSDLTTPDAAITYNLSLRSTSPSGANVGAMVYPGTGKRMISRAGNMGPGLVWSLKNLPSGSYTWSVQSIDASYQGSEFAAEGSFVISSGSNSGTVVSNEDVGALTGSFRLESGYPNPFTSSASFGYELPETGPLTATVLDILGRPVKSLAQGVQSAGYHQVIWDGTDDAGRAASAGMYFVEIRTETGSKTGKIVLAR